MSALEAVNPEASQPTAVGGACSVDSSKPNCPRNIGHREQQLSKWGGAALVLVGLSRGGWSGLATSLVGSGLMYRGWTGHCHAYDALGIDTSEHDIRTAAPPFQERLGGRRGADEIRPVPRLVK